MSPGSWKELHFAPVASETFPIPSTVALITNFIHLLPNDQLASIKFRPF